MAVNVTRKHARDFITAIRNEGMKLFRVYDSYGRVVQQFEAGAWALDGDPCMRTDYVYDGGTNRVLKMKESVDNWSALWEV